ncbi:Golgin subfamily A member 7/ERF4 family-domain-containing protein [Auriculariales sp. MPI-PUGE-AT-0066]|nr:Golgin subfamily A member 7/ERF4 family-domain-containing protein [Auriculariales sp. MPI-PUGE-AT-0066]
MVLSETIHPLAPRSPAATATTQTATDASGSGSRAESPVGSLELSFNKSHPSADFAGDDDSAEADIVIIRDDQDDRSAHAATTSSLDRRASQKGHGGSGEDDRKNERRVTLPPSPPLTVEEVGQHRDEHAFGVPLIPDEEDIGNLRADNPDSFGATREFQIIRNKPQSPQPYRKPRSSYYIGPPGSHSAFGTPQVGQIGVHDPREIVRIERDYTSGELPQFSPTFPLELEGRITATKFIETINSVNEILISAYSLRRAALDNTLAALTFYATTIFMDSHYDREMKRLAALLDNLNAELYNPRGLNILWPRRVAFLFLEIEYY